MPHCSNLHEHFLPRTGGANIVVLSGPCTSSGACAQSPNYPNSYGNSELCEIVAPDQKLYFTRFETESEFDVLTIYGQAYSGSSGPPQGTTSLGIILWNSSSETTASGWQMCTKLGTERAFCAGTCAARIVLSNCEQGTVSSRIFTESFTVEIQCRIAVTCMSPSYQGQEAQTV